MHITIYKGITFIEGRPTNCEIIGPISIELGGMISQAQLKTLVDVKAAMAAKALSAGGNAIVDFEYGQASVGWFRALLQLDDVNWYGRGQIARVPNAY